MTSAAPGPAVAPPPTALPVAAPEPLPPISSAERARRIAAIWSACFFEPDEVIELRALEVSKNDFSWTEVGYFDGCHRVEMAEAALRLTEKAKGVYWVINPIEPRLLDRSPNKAKRSKVSANDGNILCRRWFYFDFDVKRPAEIGVTDAEKAEARKVCEAAWTFLSGRGWPEPIFADSGNGYHLFYRIDLPADDGGLVLGVLNALGARFDTAAVTVDRKVFNAARICKLPYTLARKGGNTKDRPHRKSHLLSVPPTGEITRPASELASGWKVEVVPRELLEALAAEARPVAVGATSGSRPAGTAPVPTNGKSDHKLLMEAYLTHYGVGFRLNGHPGSQGQTIWALDSCPFDPSHTSPGVCVMRFPSGATHFDCQHDSCQTYKWKDFREKIGQPLPEHWDPPRETHRGPDADKVIAPAGGPGPTATNLTDVGNGRRFVKDHMDDVRYVPEWGWLVWDGQRWVRDKCGRVQELAKQTVRVMCSQAAKELSQITAEMANGLPEDKEKFQMVRKEISKLTDWALKSEDARRIQAMLAMARTDNRVVARVEQFDADPLVLNVLNGTLDLRTGILRPHDQDDFLTLLTPVAYDPAATAPTWDRLLSGIFKRDEDLIGWIQRWAGYCASGDVREQMIAILHGSGSNGKSVFIETLMDALAEYAHKANAELLLAGKSDRHETEKAALAGKRFVAACETGEGRRLNEALVKECSGGDRITARFMRQDHFTFDATFKLAVSTNHRPEIRGTDAGIWRRVRLVPFNVRYWKPGETRGPEHLRADPEMREKLKAELPGVLTWVVAGAVAWFRDGLGTCKAIETATGDYRQAEDRIGQFLEEHCEREPSAEVRGSTLFAAYKAWTAARNEHPISSTKFGLRLTEMEFGKRTSNGAWYLGLKLRAVEFGGVRDLTPELIS